MPLRVLLFDDDQEHMPLLMEEVRSWATVTQATSIDEALSLSQTDRFDVVLIDLMMPFDDRLPETDVESGYKAGAYLYERYLDEKLEGVPVVVLTAVDTRTRVFAESEAILKRHSEFRGVIRKPVEGPALKLELSRLLGRSV